MRKKIIIGILTLIVVIGITSFSYGYLIERRESGNQDLALSNFGLIIEEDMVSVTINDAYPMSDEEGTSQEETNFSIRNTSSISARYEVSLKDKEVVSTLKNEDVRYQLKRTRSTTNEEETLEIKNLKSDGIIDEGIIDGNESISYKLVIWIDYDFNTSEKGLVFSKIISLKGIQQGNLDESGANPPEMLENMIPVYYDKINDTEGVWRKADPTNQTLKYKWYDYNDFMWANAVTVKEGEKRLADSIGNVVETRSPNNVLENGNLYLDGIDDFYQLKPLTIDTEVSIVVRFKAYKFNNDTQRIISNTESGGLAIYTDATHDLCFDLMINSNYKTLNSKYKLIENTWYTVVVTYDGSNMKLYINGVEIGTLAATGTIKNTSLRMLLGAEPDGIYSYGFRWYSNIEVNKALVYTKALSASDISTYFQGEIGEYPKDNIEIETTTFQVQEYKKEFTLKDDGTIELDGVNDYLNLGYQNYDFKNAVSMVVRFKANKMSTGNDWIIGNGDGAGLMLEIVNKRIILELHVGGTYITLSSTKQLDINTWYTVIGTYDNINMKIYIYEKGKLIEKIEKALTGEIKPSTASLMLGANPNFIYPQDRFLNGIISDAFVYTDTLTDAEISEYFTGEITDYPKDNLLIAYDEFSLKDNREVYEQAKSGLEIPLDEITSMWVWIPRYKYTIFNGNNETSVEQMIDVKFEHGIETTGTVSCHDDILTGDESDHSEICEDTKNKGIKNYVSTYTHPAFTFGSEELVGFWFSKFESSTDDNTCLNASNYQNCNKMNMNVIIKPNQGTLNNQDLSYLFANYRNMETYGNIHGFPQSKEATNYLDANGNLSGEIAGDNNNYDIHMLKNMEWGAVAYLMMSKYGKYGNSLYEGNYKDVYKNNYQEIIDGVYYLKTGYSGKTPKAVASTNGVLYNNLTIEQAGQGYIGAGASTTGTVYGVYDMAGGSYEFSMGNAVSKEGTFDAYDARTWSENNQPLEKYYDKYSYITDKHYFKISKLGDGMREVLKSSEKNTIWFDDIYSRFKTWVGRGGSVGNSSSLGIFANNSASGATGREWTSRPVLTITREMPWLNN